MKGFSAGLQNCLVGLASMEADVACRDDHGLSETREVPEVSEEDLRRHSLRLCGRLMDF